MCLRSWLLLGLSLLLASCRPSHDGSLAEAQFGLIFGGQIQQRTVLPLDASSTQQPVGFRLLFNGATTRALDVEWSLDFPTARAGSRGPSNAPRSERTERTQLPKDTERFDQLLNLNTTSVPGTYNLRIRVDSKVVLDRPFRLVLNRSNDD